MKIENGFLVDSDGHKYCSFIVDIKCGTHCLHFKVQDRLILSDSVPTGKKIFGWELTTWGWVKEGKEAVLRCGAENVVIKLEGEENGT